MMENEKSKFIIYNMISNRNTNKMSIYFISFIILNFMHTTKSVINDTYWPETCLSALTYSPLNLKMNFDIYYSISTYWKVNDIKYQNETSPYINTVTNKFTLTNGTAVNYSTFEISLNNTGYIEMIIQNDNTTVKYFADKMYLKVPSDHTINNVNGDMEMQIHHLRDSSYSYTANTNYKEPRSNLVLSLILIINDEETSILDSFENFIDIRNTNQDVDEYMVPEDSTSEASTSETTSDTTSNTTSDSTIDSNIDSNPTTTATERLLIKNQEIQRILEENPETDDELVYESTKSTNYNILNLNYYVDQNKMFYYYNGNINNPVNSCLEKTEFLIINRFYSIKTYQKNYFKSIVDEYFNDGNNRASKERDNLNTNIDFSDSYRYIYMIYQDYYTILSEFQATASSSLYFGAFNYNSIYSLFFVYLAIFSIIFT